MSWNYEEIKKRRKALDKRSPFYRDDLENIKYMLTELGKGDLYIIEKLKEIDKPVILILNKIDKIKKEQILLKIDEYKDLYNFKEIIPLSALKKDNIKTLLEVLNKYLPDNIKYFDDDVYTNKRLEFLISEIVREKVFNLTNEEVPHSVAVVIDKIEKLERTEEVEELLKQCK